MVRSSVTCRIRFLWLLAALSSCFLRKAEAQSATGKATIMVGGEGDIGVTLDRPQAAFLVAGNGILIVEERSGPFLKLLDSRGKRRQLVGRVGSGPGEYRYVSAAAYDSASRRLAVFDPALRRVTFYSVGDSLTMTTSKELQLNVTAACYAGNELWVHGDHGNGAVIHRLDQKGGELVVAFSAGSVAIQHPLDGHRRFQNNVVQGPIGCDSRGRRVSVASRMLGFVQTLDIASGRVDATRMKGFIPLEFIAADRGGLLLQRGKSGEADELVAIRFRGAEQSAIIGHLMGANQGFGDYTHVREQSVAKQLTLSAQQKTVEVDAAQGRLLCYSVSPFPMIQVVAAKRCP